MAQNQQTKDITPLPEQLTFLESDYLEFVKRFVEDEEILLRDLVQQINTTIIPKLEDLIITGHNLFNDTSSEQSAVEEADLASAIKMQLTAIAINRTRLILDTMVLQYMETVETKVSVLCFRHIGKFGEFRNNEIVLTGFGRFLYRLIESPV